MDLSIFSNCRNLLAIRLSALGDVIHTIPAVQALSSDFPNLSIHWLTSPPYRELLSTVNVVEKVWTIDLKQGFSGFPGIISVLQRLRKEKFDIIIDFQGLIKSAFPARLVGGTRILGPDPSQAREPASRWFYTDLIKTSTGDIHQVEYHLELAFGGTSPKSPSPEVKLTLPNRVNGYVDQQLNKLELIRPILLNPGGGWETKRWSLDRFAKLSRLIETELKIPTLFIYGPGEEDMIRAIKDLEPDHVRTFPTSILELTGLCRRSRLMVAGDTGPMHIAVSMGTPVVAVLGPALAWRTGPFGQENLSVVHSPPCPHPYRRKCDDHFCMDISVEEVFDAVKKRLESCSARD